MKMLFVIAISFVLVTPAPAQEATRLTADALNAFPAEFVKLARNADEVAKQTAVARTQAINTLTFARDTLKAAVEHVNPNYLTLRLAHDGFVIASLDVIFAEVPLMGADTTVVKAHTAMKTFTAEQDAQWTQWLKSSTESYYNFLRFKKTDDELKERARKRMDETAKQ